MAMMESEKHTGTNMVESIVAHQQSFAQDERHWWQQPGLRRLYFFMPFLFLGSTTLGFDGSL
jgi:hypothetical protein